jgi:hypothetical protein
MSQTMFNAARSSALLLQEISPSLAKQVKIIEPTSTLPSLADLRVPHTKGAILQATAASLWPYKLICWILESLLALNTPADKPSPHAEPRFNLQTNTPVTHLQALSSDTWAIHTPHGQVTTSKILLCTNGYTSHLIPGLSDIIVPVRGEMSALIPPASARPSPETSPLTHSYGFMGHLRGNMSQDDYLIQRPFSNGKGGQLMFGGARGYARGAGVGVSDDSEIDPEAAYYLRSQLFPLLDFDDTTGGVSNDTDITKKQRPKKELKATHEWSGIMGYSRDGRPWVGRVPAEIAGGKGIFISAGFTGHGMAATPLCAKAVVEMIKGTDDGNVDLPAAYYISTQRLNRVRTKETVQEWDLGGLRDENYVSFVGDIS